MIKLVMIPATSANDSKVSNDMLTTPANDNKVNDHMPATPAS